MVWYGMVWYGNNLFDITVVRLCLPEDRYIEL